MEITRDYINQLLVKLDAWFREGIDNKLDVSTPSEYVIKPISELSTSPSYEEIWDMGEHLSAIQLADVLYSRAPQYNFWDFQLAKIQSGSMYIILFLSYYPDRADLGIHCAFPQVLSPEEDLKEQNADNDNLLQVLLKRRANLIK